MIYREHLVSSNVSKSYFGGEIEHYMPIPRAAVVESAAYKLRAQDTLFTTSKKLFSTFDNAEENWVYVAENNRLRRPQDWQMGDLLHLPLAIVKPNRLGNG